MGIEQRGWKMPEWEKDWAETERHLGRSRQSDLADFWDSSPAEVRTYLNIVYLLGNPNLPENTKLVLKTAQVNTLAEIWKKDQVVALVTLQNAIRKLQGDTGRHIK